VIFDRTQNDVDTAIRLRNEKVQKFEELTESEIVTLEKGTITINTLNRIENKIDELKGLIIAEGFLIGNIQTKSWEYAGIFNIEDFERILANLSVLKNGFAILANTPSIPSAKYHYQNLNDTEKILVDIENLIVGMKKTYFYSNEIMAGEV
jgi:hypothetical protein